MRIGVVSDTHGSTENARRATRMLETLEVEALLHCGDIGSVDVVTILADWPGHYVFGNCDYDHATLAAGIEALGHTCCGEFGEIALAGARIALLHSHDARRFKAAKTSGEYDLVCYGHTHVAKIERVGETLVLNPGALYRANPHSLALVEIDEGNVEATIVEL